MGEGRPKGFVSAPWLPVTMVLLGLLFFWEALLSGKCLYGSDFILQFYPWKKFVFDHLQSQGSLPFWNPYLFSGSPLISNIQVSLFYPLGFLYYLVPPDIAYGYSTVLHFAVGSLFMYHFMRSLEFQRAASFFSAIVFMFNGYFMGHLYAGHLSFVQNYVWIPLILYLLNASIVRGSLRFAAAAGLFLGVQILGGFPQIAFYTILASSVFMLLAGADPGSEGRKPRLLRLGGGWLLFVLFAFSVAAVQILPTYEFTTLSTRGGGVSYEMATYESLHPKELLAFLLPDIYGNPVDGTYWRSRESWHFWESCGYVGILPLFFLFVRGRSRTRPTVRAFAVMLILLALFLALGKHNPLYPLFYHLPGFGSFRIPAQIIFLYVFGVSLLSGLGLSRIMEGEWEFTKGFWIFSILAAVVLGCALVGLSVLRLEFFYSLFKNFSEGPVTHANLSLLYGRISHTIYKSCLIFFLAFFLLVLAKHGRISARLFSFLACAVVLVDLYLFAAPLVKTYEFVTPLEKKHLLSQLSRTPVTGRVVALDFRFSTNDGLRYRFPSIQGYDPLILKKYVNYVLVSQDFPPNDHVVNLQDVPLPQEKLMTLLHARQMVFEGEVRELENKIPYAFLVPKGIVKPEESILPFMKSDEFEPRQMVIFSERPKEGLLMADPNQPFIGGCEVLSHREDEIRLRISCNQPSYLVMSEIWYPGWVASVDGKNREVICGNYMFRVVPVEEGSHEVSVYFVSWPFRVGAVVSLLALGLSMCFFVIGRRR